MLPREAAGLAPDLSNTGRPADTRVSIRQRELEKILRGQGRFRALGPIGTWAAT
jgi:hypothetical protein